MTRATDPEPHVEGPVAAVVLAAGYGTRLGALGRDRPKALLPVGGRTVLDRLMVGLVATGAVEGCVVVTNHRFVGQLRSWERDRTLPFPVRIVDDGTATPGERLGAVGDLALGLDAVAGAGPVLVAGSDNVFDFSLEGLIRAAAGEEGVDAVVTVVEEDDPERLRASGVAEVDAGGRVTRFREKPDQPASTLAVPPLYLLGEEAAADVERYLEGGGEPDAPGHFLEWLVRRRRVRAWPAPGPRYDVGTLERYERARRRLGPEG